MENDRVIKNEMSLLEDYITLLNDRLSDIECKIGIGDAFIEYATYEWDKSSFFEDWDIENQIELSDDYWTHDAFDYDLYFLRKEKIKIESQIPLVKSKIKELKEIFQTQDNFLIWIQK